MQKIIDADALKRDLIDNYSFYPAIVKNAIEKAPAINPEDLRPKGKWNILEGTRARRVCSCCGWDVAEYGKFYSYCPNCGAKMEE